ncbi:MAG: pyrroline-5-carboxylate reductase [Candidatus Methanomethylophilaceae archaeon]|nr:pyrroline-5-carboxylate reductase [Candidatus Methanomethylophilaceae archaeon]
MERRLGFIGAGNMAEALMKGVIAHGLYAAEDIIASEIYRPRREHIAQKLGVQATDDNAQVVDSASIVVLAVKPQHLAEVLEPLADRFRADQLVVSIVAGITIKALEKMMPAAKVVRVMPNQPCMSMASATAFSRGKGAGEEDAQAVRAIFESVGVAYEVQEKLLDAVTGLSGSGPAYAYLMIEALADGGVLMGLPRDIAQSLAAQTLLGAAKTVLDTGEHPGRLKDMVCSPGGTTIAAMQVLEEAGVRAALMGAVQASAEKSKELGK